MKKIKNILFLGSLALVFCLFSGCSSASKSPISVSSLELSAVTVQKTGSTATTAPVSYSATVKWNTSAIMADEKASAALTGLKVSLMDGSKEILAKELTADVTSHTFTGLLPGESRSLTVTALYAEGVYDKTFESDSIHFVGGPWFDGTVTELPSVEGFSVGSFNRANSLPTGSYYFDDYYYYNPHNTDYLFKAVGDVKWFAVKAAEVTTTNDTVTQRNNVQWLVNNFRLLDMMTVSNTTDIASVDSRIYDIYGRELYSITGTSTGGAMTSTNFNNLISSVDSGYYADKTGYFFIKTTCRTMPTIYSDQNPDKLGRWGFGIIGPRRY